MNSDNYFGGDAVHAQLRIYGELKDFLSSNFLSAEYRVEFPEQRSVKDLIESEGIPHTEVGLILVNGESSGFNAPVGDGERVAVYPHFSNLPAERASAISRPPLPVLRFVADIHLGKLVRRLRLLGYDCAYGPGFEDEQLAERSAREERVLLTRDRGLLMRRIVVHGIFVHSDDVRQQLQQVVEKTGIDPARCSLSRCLECNGRLKRVDREQVRELVPTYTYETTDIFLQCQECGKPYWKGTHWPKLRGFIDEIDPAGKEER
ncbi:MAG: Mut7-C RNAse domain-containing protein [Verrucomicrobiota bacterium]